MTSIDFEIHSTCLDDQGRYIIIDVTINEVRLTLANIYGPNEDDTEFFMSVFDKIEQMRNDNRIIAGDFNCTLNDKQDKKGR